MIPREINFVHFDVGQPPACPDQSRLLESWGYDVRWWDERDLDSSFRLADNIRTLIPVVPAAAADLMRYEILARRGGLYFDTDFFFFQPFPSWIHDCESVGAYEDEFQQRCVGNAFLGCSRDNSFFRGIVDHFIERPSQVTTHAGATQRSGPWFITKRLVKEKYTNFTYLPSHFVYPRFFPRRGKPYTGGGPVYAQHLWQASK